jgi:hypothetical protein
MRWFYIEHGETGTPRCFRFRSEESLEGNQGDNYEKPSLRKFRIAEASDSLCGICEKVQAGNERVALVMRDDGACAAYGVAQRRDLPDSVLQG